MVEICGQDSNGVVILRTMDGMIVYVSDEAVVLKNIIGKKRTERKTFEYIDMIAINDALKIVYRKD